METTKINAGLLARMFLAGAKNLEANREWINELNVFPVPDGDTGTNMTMTIMSAAAEVAALEEPDMKTLCKAISSGSLRGARGNSGVILSQLFRGFTKGIRDYQELDKAILAAASQKAVETAYKAVMKPKEGTILTVAKSAADKAAELQDADIELKDFLAQVIAHADYVLSQTPEMLPVLKEAGVVDSGGQGLVQVLKGALDAFLGKEIDYSIQAGEKKEQEKKEPEYEYGVSYALKLKKDFQEKELKTYLEALGGELSLQVSGSIVRVALKTNDPGKTLTKALNYGSLGAIRIENLKEELTEEKLKEEEEQAKKAAEPKKPVGFISVSVGAGMAEIFKGLGVDCLIEGGQTMNPSTDDMLHAIAQVNAENIFILPNNKNIILAANQAQSLEKEKKIYVIPTRTIPQGITAIINYNAEKTPEENFAAMTEGIAGVKTGQITYAVRDTHIDDKEIHEGDIMGIGDHAILAVGKGIGAVALETIRLMSDEDSELISIYYGEDVTEEDAQKFAGEVAEAYPECDVETYSGGQPIYYYVISVE